MIMMKWKNIVAYVLKKGHSLHIKNKPYCENKRNILSDNFTTIIDYMVKIRHDEE
jgi:hypothetical protein